MLNNFFTKGAAIHHVRNCLDEYQTITRQQLKECTVFYYGHAELQMYHQPTQQMFAFFWNTAKPTWTLPPRLEISPYRPVVSIPG